MVTSTSHEDDENTLSAYPWVIQQAIYAAKYMLFFFRDNIVIFTLIS